jgi:hypothetical protein
MPFNLQVQPRMGDYMLSAAQSIAGNIQQARKKKEETEQKLGESDILLDYAKKHNLVTPEEETKYFGASADQKVGMADAWSKTIALNQAQELQASRLAQELAISQASQANQMAIAGIGTQGMGEPVYVPGAPQTRENLLGFRTRGGGVDALPQGVGAVPLRNAKGAPITAEDLEVYDIPDAQGKSSGNKVTRIKGTNQIVPNSMIQGVVRPDPQALMMQEYLDRQQRQQNTGKTWADLAASWFAGNKAQAAATPPPTAGPSPGPAQAGTIPTVSNQADYDNLPSGSVYIAPDGSKRTKP